MAASTRTVNVKFDGDAKGLQRAAKDGEREVDRFGKSIDKKFRESGDKSGKGFSQGLKKWFSPAALGDLKKAGEFGGSLFGSGLLGAIKTPVLGPAILAAAGVAAAVAAPTAGAIVAAGIVAGFGAGLAGLGIMFAAKSKKVQDVWHKTLSGMGADMQLLSKPFEATLISIAGFAQRTFNKFKPSLEAVFKELAPAVTKFVDQVARGFERLQPVIRPMAEAFGAVLDSLGPAIQGAIGKTADGLGRLAESVKKNPDGLADMVTAVGNLTGSMLDLLTALNNAYDGLKKLGDNIPIVSVVMDKAGISWGNLAGSVVNAIPGVGAANTAIDLLGQSTDKAGESAGLTGDAVKLYTQGLDANQTAAVLAGDAAKGATPKVETLAEKYERQWRATQKANEELFRNSGLLLTLSGAQISYEQAVDDATAAVKENGKTHDITTEAGRRNKAALDQVAASANAQSESSRNAGKASVASATSARAAYEKQAIQMGYTKTEAKRMAAEFIKIPKKTQADFKGDITDLDAKIRTAKAKLKDPNLTATKRAKLEAEIAKLLASKRQAQAAIDALHGKTVTVNIQQKYTSTGVNLTSPSSVGRRASGGLLQPNRSYLINERGPEILTMGSQGGRVTSAEQSRQAVAGGNSGPIIVENHIEIGGEVVRVVKTEIKANDANTKRRATAGVR